MKKNRGFSIPELLAVIVIIGILATIATASYNGISKSMKEKTYNNKVNLIKTKALEYAADNGVDVATISVAKLISEGYLDVENETDNNEKMNNPLGGYLDCYKVDINRNLDDYDVSVSNSEDCSLAETDIMASNIKVSLYADDGETLSNANLIGSNKDIKWTNKNVYLYLNPSSLGNNASQEMSITWSINGDNKVKTGNIVSYPSTDTNYANIYKLETLYLLNVNVVVKIQTEKGMLSKSVNVKIDKEKPTVTLDTDASYESASKVITFNGSDGSGSGFSGYSYALTEKKEDTPVFNITSTDNKIEVYKNQKYYAYARDVVGNISDAVEIDITNIDNSKPVCKNPENNTGWTNVNYSYVYGCDSDHGSGCATPDVKETQNDEAEFKEVKWTIKDNVGNARTCTSNVAVHVDKTAPTCEIQIDSSSKKGNNNWYIGDVKLNLITKDNMSGVSEYGITTNTSPEYNGQKTAVLNHDTESSGITYYGYVKDRAGNTNTCKITVKRLTEAPSCTLTSSGNLGNNGWYTSNVNITMNSNSKYVTGKNVNSTNKDTYTLTSDTKGTTIKGIVTNDAGLTGDCSISVKRDTEAPSCNVNASGTMGQNNWYTSNVAMSISATDATSGVAKYGLNANSTNYNNSNRQNLTWDTDGITYYGIVMDNAGNQRDCSKSVKRLSEIPSCYFEKKGTSGNNGWYVSNVTATIRQSPYSHHITGLIVTSEDNSYFNNLFPFGILFNKNIDKITQRYLRVTSTVKGMITNAAGISSECVEKINIDRTPPTCVVKTNKVPDGDNGWYRSSVDVTLEVGDSGSGVASKGLTTNSSYLYNGNSSYTLDYDTASMTYYGIVKDNAGNESKCNSSQLKRDTVAPSCNWPDKNKYTSWGTDSRSVRVTCSDSLSGCASGYDGHTWTYSSGTFDKLKLSYNIKDNAGNTTSCSENNNIYIDTEAPVLNAVNASSFLNWNKTEVTCDGYNCKLLYKKNDLSQWTTGLVQVASKASPLAISVGWSFRDDGSGIKSYDVTVSDGIFKSNKTCYPKSDCNFLTFFSPKTMDIIAEDNLGHKSGNLHTTIKCQNYLGPTPTWESNC